MANPLKRLPSISDLCAAEAVKFTKWIKRTSTHRRTQAQTTPPTRKEKEKRRPGKRIKPQTDNSSVFQGNNLKFCMRYALISIIG